MNRYPYVSNGGHKSLFHYRITIRCGMSIASVGIAAPDVATAIKGFTDDYNEMLVYPKEMESTPPQIVEVRCCCDTKDSMEPSTIWAVYGAEALRNS